MAMKDFYENMKIFKSQEKEMYLFLPDEKIIISFDHGILLFPMRLVLIKTEPFSKILIENYRAKSYM